MFFYKKRKEWKHIHGWLVYYFIRGGFCFLAPSPLEKRGKYIVYEGGGGKRW